MTNAPTATQRRSAAYVLGADEVRRNPNAWPATKADSTDTAGLLGVFEDTLQPWQSGPPLHLHTNLDEAFYVVEGTLLVKLGDEQREVSRGSFVWIPRGTPHAFANASDTPTRLLGLTTPGGIEEFFAEQGAYFAQLEGAPDLAILGSIGARYGSQLLGPGIEVAAPGAPQS